jgi:hypothetical protein
MRLNAPCQIQEEKAPRENILYRAETGKHPFQRAQKARLRLVYHWKDKNVKRVDFLIRQGQDITAALEACQDIDDDKTRKWEIPGALPAVAAFVLPEGTLRKTIKAF